MTIDHDPEPEKISRSFFDSAQGKPVGANILADAMAVQNHFGRTGVIKSTLRAWRRAKLVVLDVEMAGRHPHRRTVITGVYLTPKGVEACCVHEAKLMERALTKGEDSILRKREREVTT